MAVSVVTLWLIYVLTILVVAIVLCLPDMKIYQQSLIAVFFATVIGAVVVSFVPVDLSTDAAVMSYNSLIVVAYLLPIILIIVIAGSGIHHHYHRQHHMGHMEHMGNKKISADITCERDENGEPENCRLEEMTMRKGDNKVRVSFR